MKYFLALFVVFLFFGCSDKPIDAEALYKEDCSNCHGKFARKSAFGKSQIIAGFSKEQIQNALQGYQDETYGKSMKSMMRAEVKSLSKSDIEAVAIYVYSLNH